MKNTSDEFFCAQGEFRSPFTIILLKSPPLVTIISSDEHGT